MSQSLQDTVEKFKNVMEEMQRKVAAMQERTDEAYKKMNLLEAQKYSLIDTNEQLSKELRKLSYQVAIFEDQKASQERIYHIPGRKGTFTVEK